MRVRREPREFYSGRMLESDMFGDGRFMQNPLFVAHYRALARRDGWVSFPDAVRLVRDHYPGNPTNPKKEIPNALRLAVCDALKLPEEARNRVKVYSAVGTPLDRIHGADAFIVYEPMDGPPSIVTIDVTQRTEKLEEGHKADIIVGEFADSKEERAQFLTQVRRVAHEVVTRLKTPQRSPTVYRA